MKLLFKTQTVVASLLTLCASLSPALAGGGTASIRFADMTPMQPQGSPSTGAITQFSMMGDKMGVPPPPAPGGGASMAPAPPASSMPGGMMDDGKMAMPPPNAAAPAGGMSGMPPSALPGGMPAVAGMMPMPGGMMPMMEMMMQMGKGQAPPAAPLDHVEGRIGFLKAELGITEAQASTWDQFAQDLRTSQAHLTEARQALLTSMGGQSGAPGRLEAYEHHLSMRLDSLHAARESFQRLYALLSVTQKKAADELVVPVLVSF